MMPFVRHGLFFRQDFECGYRYLDHCGEFLVRAQNELDLLPTGDQTPSGGTMEAPDLGIKVEVNTLFLRVIHELPGDNLNAFVAYSKAISSLYHELFSPRSVEKDSIACTSYISFPDWEKACNRSLKWGQNSGNQEALGRTIGMSPASKLIEYTFSSGSRTLTTKVRPITFDNIRLNNRNATSQATKTQKKTIERQNAGNERIRRLNFAHALYLELDLAEVTPPRHAFDNLFADIMEKETMIAKTVFNEPNDNSKSG